MVIIIFGILAYDLENRILFLKQSSFFWGEGGSLLLAQVKTLNGRADFLVFD